MTNLGLYKTWAKTLEHAQAQEYFMSINNTSHILFHILPYPSSSTLFTLLAHVLIGIFIQTINQTVVLFDKLHLQVLLNFIELP